MKRTIQSPTMKTNAQMLHAFASQILGRVQLMSQMGLHYGGARDIYQALGYIQTLSYDDYLGRYTRQDMAKAIIDRPVKATWQGPLELIEANESEDTAFEKEWNKLNRLLKIKSTLARADKLTGIGRYGIIVLGLDDVKNLEGFKTTVASGKRKLLYLKPFGEKSAKITEFVNSPKDKRYGQPLYYTVEVADVSSGTSGATSFIQIHHSRIIHITDDNMESEIYGTPRLEVVYNRLMDLEKLVGGDAEMFWRGARPGYEGKVDKDYQMTEAMKEDLKDQLDEYENNLRRFLINEGVDMEALVQQVSDPANHVDVQIQMISAVTGIPKRILTGSERGELASTQDSSEWKDYVQARREDHAEPNIVRVLVDRLIELQILPTPAEDYTVKWNDLYSLSEKARVEIGKGRANALREYTYNPIAEALVPPDAFLEFFLGLTTEQITLIRKMRDAMINEDELTDVIMDTINPPEPVTLPAGTPMKKTTPMKRTIAPKKKAA